MMRPEHLREYMDNHLFVADCLGLSRDLAPSASRLIFRPSFHPEEVWDVSPSGLITWRRANESIWASIPQRLKMAGDKDWKYYSDANFDASLTSTVAVAVETAQVSSLVRCAIEYKDDGGLCADGMQLTLLHQPIDEMVISIDVANPRPGPFAMALARIAKSLQSAGADSSIDKYLTPN